MKYALLLVLMMVPIVDCFGGESDRIELLEQRIESLEKKLAVVMKQLSQVQKKLGDKETVSGAEQGTSRPGDLAKWRKLRKGMSKDQVEALLGHADRREVIPRGPEMWYYGTNEGTPGAVAFDAKEKIEEWFEPKPSSGK